MFSAKDEKNSLGATLWFNIAHYAMRSWPWIVTGLVAVAAAASLPPGAAGTLFALGRTAGWIAHVLEQRTEPSLLRPRARYVGR